jgi:hypothetical protein
MESELVQFLLKCLIAYFSLILGIMQGNEARWEPKQKQVRRVLLSALGFGLFSAIVLDVIFGSGQFPFGMTDRETPLIIGSLLLGLFLALVWKR